MAKKDKQGKRDKTGGAADAVDAIRSTIERTLEGAGLTEKRQREFVEQLSGAAGRIRQTIDDLKVVDEVQDLRAQLEHLAARVAELESSARMRVAGAARTAAGLTPGAASRPKPAATASRSNAKPKAKARAKAAARAKPKARATAKPRAKAASRNGAPAKAKPAAAKGKAKASAKPKATAKAKAGGSSASTS